MKLQKIRDFIHETQVEMKKCTWTARDELFQSTILVITAMLILGTFVALFDQLSAWFIGLLTSGSL